jgi:hypothetical protein
MKRASNYRIEKESLERQKQGRRYNPGVELHVGSKWWPLPCGYADDITVFEEQGGYYVLSMHSGLGYVGLTWCDDRACCGKDEPDNVFVQSEPESFFDGRDPFKMDESEVAETLAHYLP